MFKIFNLVLEVWIAPPSPRGHWGKEEPPTPSSDPCGSFGSVAQPNNIHPSLIKSIKI
jgi:hypothetical protein